MINPTQRQHIWMARNVQLRDYRLMGNTTTDAECPEGLFMPDISNVSHAVKPPETMPVGCRSVTGLVGGAAAGQTQVIRLEWTWEAAHLPDVTFDLVLRVLQPKVLSGSIGCTGADERGASGPRRVGTPARRAPARAQHPPASPTPRTHAGRSAPRRRTL